MDYQALQEHGIDYRRGISRCMDDAGFYEQFLNMFLSDDSYARTKAAYERGDLREMFSCAHELKGVSGNAEMTDLFNAVSPLVELLRGGTPEAGELSRAFTDVENEYHRALKGVMTALSPHR